METIYQVASRVKNERDALNFDQRLKESQLERKQKRLEEADKQIKILKENFKLMCQQSDELKDIIRKKIPEGEEILSQPIFYQIIPCYCSPANVVKTIRGGHNRRNTASFVPLLTLGKPNPEISLSTRVSVTPHSGQRTDP